MSFFYPNKHTYLQKVLIFDVSQKVLNTIIDKALDSNVKYRSLKSTFPKLETRIPIIWAPNVDVTRAKKAYGRWALPKLKKELHHDDLIIVKQALNTISDMVHDPEKAFEAIRIGVIDRLVNMMKHEKDFIRETVCVIFYTLSSQDAGRRAIVRRYQILKNLASLLEDKVPTIKRKAQLIIEMISRNHVGRDALNSAGFCILLLRLIGGTPCTENDDVLILHLATLERLLEGDVNVRLTSLQHNGLNILMKKIEHPVEDLSSLALSCISILCWDPAGRDNVYVTGYIVNICKKIFDVRRKVHTKATACLMFASLKQETRTRVAIACLLDRLVDLLEDFHSSELQLMAAKLLTILAEVPLGRDHLSRKKILKRIYDLYTFNDKEVDRHKNILLKVINWKP